jgi:hypothetical protein
VWELTPRQIEAYTQIAARRVLNERAQLLAITAIGAQGTGKSIESQLKEWEQQT